MIEIDKGVYSGTISGKTPFCVLNGRPKKNIFLLWTIIMDNNGRGEKNHGNEIFKFK